MKLFATFFTVMLLAAGSFSHANCNTDLNFEESASVADAPRFGRPGTVQMYSILTRLFRGGNFESIRRSLPELQEMGMNALLISPPNPQSAQFHEVRGTNNHGYWISSHSEIDPSMGGEEAFNRLVTEAKERNIRIVVDAVLNQFGYGKEFQMGKKTISVDDPNYFIQPEPEVANGRPRAYDILDEMDGDVTPERLRVLKAELEKLPLYELPSLRQDNPEVANYLVDSYKKFVDRGIEVFRIDAAKHITDSFLIRFINEMNEYAESKGMKLTFICESIAANSKNFSYMVKDILKSIHNRDSVVFIDFPLRAELVRLQDRNYKFEWFMSFIKFRDEDKQPLRRYLPVVQDHDFGHPIDDPFLDRLTHVLSEFFSYNSPFLYHGAEQSGNIHRNKSVRYQLNGVNPHGDMVPMRRLISKALKPFRQSKVKPRMIVHRAGHDILFVQKQLEDGRSIFILVNKGNDNLFDFVVSKQATGKINVVFREGNNSIRREKNRIITEINGRGILIFEVLPR
jgi:glycosidase